MVNSFGLPVMASCKSKMSISTLYVTSDRQVLCGTLTVHVINFDSYIIQTGYGAVDKRIAVCQRTCSCCHTEHKVIAVLGIRVDSL